MAAVIRELAGVYRWLIYDLADERTQGWFLVKSPWPVIALLVAYVYFVRVLGPKLMIDRKPFMLDRIIQVYNVIQIALSLFIVERSLSLAWGGQYSWVCAPLDRSTDPTPMTIARCCYYFYWIKIFDLMDTVFFVLRKKNAQITFLHVYHHAGMVAAIWGAVKYLPGGHGTFLGFINSMVHAVMYTYYLVTSIYPQHKKNIWWKKYITQMQMVQFFMITVHALQLVFQPNCDFPLIYPFVIVPQNAFMFVLFYDFYRKAYFPRKKQPSPAEVTHEPATKPHES